MTYNNNNAKVSSPSNVRVRGVVAVAALFAGLTAHAIDAPASHITTPTIFIAGDSTAAKSSDPQQQGWAEPFASFFDTGGVVAIANRSRGGRSSRTFITEGHWDALLAEIKPGDLVLIQFGHNDAGALNEEPPGSTKPLRARGTIPGIGEESQEIDNVITGKHEVVHTFGWYIRKMIADVRAKQATPLLLSLTLRNAWTNGRIDLPASEYREWIKQLARAQDVAFVDVSSLIADRYQRLGEKTVGEFFPKDAVHTNSTGAEVNAASVVAGLKQLPGQPFNRFMSEKGRATN